MNDERELPEVPVSALRDHADSERVDRVWRRIEQDIPAASVQQRSALWWAPAAVVIVFGCGVFVGARWFRAASPHATTVAAEPVEPLDQPHSSAELPGAARAGVRAAEPARRRERERNPAPAPMPARGQAQVNAATLASPVSAGPPAWQRRANAGDFAAAHRALDDQGGFDSAVGKASAEQLMSLFDIARFAGRRDRALEALRRVVSRFPDDPNAPLAAWTLGNVLDKAGDHAGAAEAFRVYRRLSPGGDFAEDALARQVEIAIEEGNLDQARRLADHYAKDFPKGRRLGEIREQLARASGTDAGVAPAAEAGAGVAALDEESQSGDASTGPAAVSAPWHDPAAAGERVGEPRQHARGGRDRREGPGAARPPSDPAAHPARAK